MNERNIIYISKLRWGKKGWLPVRDNIQSDNFKVQHSGVRRYRWLFSEGTVGFTIYKLNYWFTILVLLGI